MSGAASWFKKSPECIVCFQNCTLNAPGKNYTMEAMENQAVVQIKLLKSISEGMDIKISKSLNVNPKEYGRAVNMPVAGE